MNYISLILVDGVANHLGVIPDPDGLHRKLQLTPRVDRFMMFGSGDNPTSGVLTES